jgi:hypothetical protein
MNSSLFIATVAAVSALVRHPGAERLILAPTPFSAATLQAHSIADNTSPLIATAVTLGDVTPTITFTVINSSTKAVTAWRMDIIVGGQFTGHSVDDYEAFEQGRPAKAYLLPLGSVTVTVLLSGSVPASSVPKITFIGAIYADKTSVGDPKWVDSIFQSRAARLAAWSQVVEQLDNLRQSSALTVDALNSVAVSLDARPQTEDPGYNIRRATAANIRMLIKDAQNNPANVRPRLEYWLTAARSSEAAVAAHVR